MFGPGKIGMMELIVIFAIALVVFGPAKLPELGKSMGEAIRQFKDSSKEITKSIDDDDNDNKD
ncbi:MAG TPA: twin-arginine translocase TatA/TatE family subunit [Tissierellaceae bacterium]|nr:twin-arginine translocase TatA/TatE family subunit [Tissierellaceae bacterium]